MLYKESIKDGIEIIRCHYDTILWIKLDKNFFNVENDVYICGVYVWCDDSPAYTVCNVDLFDVIQNDIFEFENAGDLFLIGDWNSRVGKRNDYIVCDSVNYDIDCDGYDPDVPLTRASCDSGCNVFGHRLLDLCKSTSLRILNGRADDDRNGAFTFISSQGASVIDYLLTKDCNFSLICNFTVHDLNEWSDH